MPPDDLPPDLQRPLDEAIPTQLRPAIPIDPDPGPEPEPQAGPEPKPEPEPEPEPEPRAEAEAETEAEAEPDREPDASPKLPAGVVRHAAAGFGAALVAVALAPARAIRRAGRALARWSHAPSGRFAIPSLIMVALVAAAGVGGSLLVPAVGSADGAAPVEPAPGSVPTAPPLVPAAPTAPPPLGPTAPPVGEGFGLPGTRAEALQGWAEQMSGRTGIPAVALQAYGYAELVVARTTPRCQLSWTTLAAIGRVESNHGHSGSSQLLPDGRALPPITGAPLDGLSGTELIPDTDGGELDGDARYDRAVGPMQFIPGTWRGEAVDATGDGVADIHNIHDAALAAANYLCRHGRDLTTPNGWWSAILAYNNVQAYADAVFAAANEYGQLSRS